MLPKRKRLTMPMKLNLPLLVTALSVSLLVTGCAKRVEVGPSLPVPPPKVQLPRVVTDPVALPTWLQSPPQT